ncbi:MAG TPA: tRNA epoxyqueuosine(34) reductase QueG [Phycisphaerae bacterium]
MSPTDKSRIVQQLGAALRFDRIGVARAAELPRADYLTEWLRLGRAGKMQYLHHHDALRRDPQGLLPGARSIIVTALNYRQPAPAPPTEGQPRGRVAMYAWGADYHEVVRGRLERLVAGMRAAIDEPFDTRICVDSAPLVEREWAAAAGVGWIGKNTLVLDPELGSTFFLGEIVTTLDLAPDEPVTDHCGSCTRCLEACPTQAFPRAYEMDASRCISYFTIELRDAIPPEFHSAIGDWVFGCDICQDVCPFNRKAPTTPVNEFAARPPNPWPSLLELLNWSPEDYRAKLKGSAMKRAKLEMLKRNAAIALENASVLAQRAAGASEPPTEVDGATSAP